LRLNCILRGVEERFDTQVLFDPFEEQLDLPAIRIQLGNRLGWQGEVVGEKTSQGVSRLLHQQPGGT